jgi:hypothetical protein
LRDLADRCAAIGLQFGSFPAAELFYRLESLRLNGFINSAHTGKDPSGKGLYSYDLTPEARELIG